ncbi:MAG: class I SAM-dependent methyltransferase [Proteobacteria bacterium]|nr:class I SAM-dependent methyltransferase [Pseudomonadota bacterium]
MNTASHVLEGAARASAAPRGRLTRVLRERVLERLEPLAHARLEIEDAWGRRSFGEPGAPLSAQVRMSDAECYRALALGGSVGAAESFMAGHWECDDLVSLVRILVRNRDLLDGLEGGFARVAGALLRAGHALRRNTLAGSRRNVAAHYDLGNEFFRLFLSQDLMYSSALWEEGPGDTLERASERKLERICQELELGPDDHVIEIGTGWGGFALHAAGRYGCRVTTTTLSREQESLAHERIAQAGLSGKVTVLRQDYRELTGRYDKLVSIEMVEAIGARYLDTYFGQIQALLKPDGLAVLQAITIEDHRYLQALRSVDFIKRHVFPGSFIPSVNALIAAKTAASDLALLRLHDFGLSYARTLATWRERFLARLDEVRAQGFDERFIRLWHYYLAYCEGGFRERSIGVAQLTLARPDYRPRAVR